MLDNVFRWNARAVLRNALEAEVLSLYFPYLGQALVIDFRHTPAEGPFVTVDAMVSRPEKRIESLKRLRPGFEAPRNLPAAPWGGPVRSLESTGALDSIAGRLRGIGYSE